MDKRLVLKPRPKQPPPNKKRADVQRIQHQHAVHSNSSSSSSAMGGKNGFLGKFLSAQRRTASCLAAVPKSAIVKAIDAQNIDNLDDDDNVDNNGTNRCLTKQQVLAKFRESVAQKFLTFQSSKIETSIKIAVLLSEHVGKLSPSDKDGRIGVNLDVLKFIVHEQVEEIGDEDNWIAAKEPNAEFFMDECNIMVYKDGHCPPEVLEELNKGEMTDEVRGQQQALKDAQLKQAARENARHMAMITKKEQESGRMRDQSGSSGNEDVISTLNTKKRDRRSIEEIQRDMHNDHKRGRI